MSLHNVTLLQVKNATALVAWRCRMPSFSFRDGPVVAWARRV